MLQRRAPAWAAIGLALAIFAALAQAPRLGPDEVQLSAHAFRPVLAFHAQAGEVQIAAVVRDAAGHAVGGLGRGDFQVLDNGRLRALTAFSVESRDAVQQQSEPGASAPVSVSSAPSAPPRAVAFLFDDLNTLPNQQDTLAHSRAAAAALLQSESAGLPPGERIAVFTTSGDVTQDFTADRAPLLAALTRIAPRSRAAPLGCPLITPYQAYEISKEEGDSQALSLAVAQALHLDCACSGLTVARCTPLIHASAESVLAQSQVQAQETLDALQAAVEALRQQVGERLLLLASPGFPSPDLQPQLMQAVNRSLSAGVVVNALDSKGLDAPVAHNNPDDPPVGDPGLNSWRDSTASDARDLLNAGMAQVAEDSGGRLMENTNDLTGTARQLAQASETYYLLTFSTAGVVPDGSLHRLAVKILAPGHYEIQARRGYLAPPKPGSVVDMQARLNQEALATDQRNELPVHVSLDEQAQAGGERLVHVVVTVDPGGLPFVSSEDRNLEQLSFVAVLSDDRGGYVSGEQGEMNLHLTDASRRALGQPDAGLHAGLSLSAPPGHYHLRVVVEESVKGRISAASTGLTVH